MLKKGDFKIRLHGKRLKGDFALIHIKARRPGSKGTEWLLIKKQDDEAVSGYDIEQYDTSVLSKKTITQMAGDEGAAEWKSSRPASRGRLKAPWLAETLAKLEKKGKTRTTEDTEDAEEDKRKPRAVESQAKPPKSAGRSSKNSASSESSAVLVGSLPGVRKASMPTTIHPMLATSGDKPFDDPDWLFEIKWDGYRAVAFIENGKVRLVSRNQNDLTGQFSELHDLPKAVKAKTAVLDGEIVALDEQGRSSFSLMQQRTGFRSGGRRAAGRSDVPVVYYVFDLIFVDGYDLRRVPLKGRKAVLAKVVAPNELVRLSEHFPERGIALFNAAKQQGLEGILAKRRDSLYEERRSNEWRKIKITQTIDCVIGGYTDPEGSREYFGAIVLGLYDQKGRLVHVGQAGTGFDQAALKQIWQVLHKLETSRSPFHGGVEAAKVHWVEPQRVAEIKFTEWTHETEEGGPKLRAPVFMGLRDDKDPRECKLEGEIIQLRT